VNSYSCKKKPIKKWQKHLAIIIFFLYNCFHTLSIKTSMASYTQVQVLLFVWLAENAAWVMQQASVAW
jgi:hypothetical protein